MAHQLQWLRLGQSQGYRSRRCRGAQLLVAGASAMPCASGACSWPRQTLNRHIFYAWWLGIIIGIYTVCNESEVAHPEGPRLGEREDTPQVELESHDGPQLGATERRTCWLSRALALSRPRQKQQLLSSVHMGVIGQRSQTKKNFGMRSWVNWRRSMMS